MLGVLVAFNGFMAVLKGLCSELIEANWPPSMLYEYNGIQTICHQAHVKELLDT
jgi:hypothetical protein